LRKKQGNKARRAAKITAIENLVFLFEVVVLEIKLAGGRSLNLNECFQHKHLQTSTGSQTEVGVTAGFFTPFTTMNLRCLYRIAGCRWTATISSLTFFCTIATQSIRGTLAHTEWKAVLPMERALSGLRIWE